MHYVVLESVILGAMLKISDDSVSNLYYMYHRPSVPTLLKTLAFRRFSA